jgi:putative RNA 2'-phosphotransferase
LNETKRCGATEQALTVISVEGLKPMRRQYVHLSVDQDTAYQIGSRKRGKTVVVTVMAGEAYGEGIAFYKGNEIVWLADHIPPQYIR